MRKISLSVIGTLLGLCAVLSVSYAFYVVLPTNKASASTNVAITECGSIILRDVQALTLTGDKSAPIKDFKVLNSPEGYEYTFIVTNPCSESSNLQVSLVPKTNSDMPVKAIKYALKEEKGTYPSEGTFLNKKKLEYNEITQSELSMQLGSTYTTGYEVLQTTLGGKETKTYKLLLWIDYEEGGLGDNATMNKTFDSYLVLSDNLGDVAAGGITITFDYNGSALPNYSLSKYNFDITGCNGTTYNSKYQAFDFSYGNEDCTIKASNAVTGAYTPISTTISNLVNTTSSQTDWKVLSENGIRYEGANPDNYVWFNNELWRIIGVFDVETEDGTTQKLTKIIRNNPINNLAWDGKSSGYKNFWSQSTLYKLLNPVSGDANSGAYYNGVDNNTYCYGYSTYKKGDCNFSADGITSASYRNMIAKVVWKFGGMSNSTSSNWTAPNIYTAEQGTHVHSSNSSYGTPEVLNYIGLMYASDFGYSALGCSRTTSMNSYSSCIANAWLYTPYAWTLSPRSSSSNVVFRVYIYNLNSNDAFYGYAVRPSLYLKSNVYIAGGSGAPSDPYIIKEA